MTEYITDPAQLMIMKMKLISIMNKIHRTHGDEEYHAHMTSNGWPREKLLEHYRDGLRVLETRTIEGLLETWKEAAEFAGATVDPMDCNRKAWEDCATEMVAELQVRGVTVE